jgi:chorismate synthase
VLEGIPAGLRVERADIDEDLRRRQGGYGRGGRMAIESDRCALLAGVRHGLTLGTPICVAVENRDHANWALAMSPDPTEQTGVAAELRPSVTIPRPGHADLAGAAKYGHRDLRNVLERASARETVGRVAGGAVCKLLLRQVGVFVRARVVGIGGVSVETTTDFMDATEIDWEAVEKSPVACEDTRAGDAMCGAIDEAAAAGESLGGVIEAWCWGVCPGVGSYASATARLDGRLMGGIGSIPAIKAVELGLGMMASGRLGSEVHDGMEPVQRGGRTTVGRTSNRAGGLEGGVTNGLPVVIRAYMKPIPTLTSPLPSVDLSTLEAASAHVERSDVCAVPAARVVVEAVAAYVLAGAYLEKFGGDSVGQLVDAVRRYEGGLEERGLWRRS